ncbi:MAG: UTP--glucose-1-phosphate uridylyltransferase GalU [Ruminococcus sp.]|nr:UTP--glucose-1-phosphate uridylyltransferase GalU [Ruminococcus sp.]MCM1382840.1 UTP--glucose-1-phosphate uridylyltransferase GalU [Muribaculaceae bacterium]MCM1480624.1 UTP--glucose-1-phosphate uridylyltransferase GalU [Muribaculaceae bacterium]
MEIKKAVITAAGYGTRMLPATKSMPKEMLPILDKPAIQYIVEECVNAGITDILIILSRGKHVVEDHFDRSPDLERQLRKSGKDELYKQLVNIAEMANIVYVRQAVQLGLGHAVLCAKGFAGDEPFAVLYGDDVIIGDDPAIAQLCRAYGKYGKGTVGIKEVPTEDVMRYSSMKLETLADGCFSISDMIEKPAPEQIFSNYSILGRCILPSKIFKILEETPWGKGGELQLTDAMKTLANREGMIGVDFTGTRYDMGNRLSALKASIEEGLRRPDMGGELREYIKEISQKM